MTIEKSIQKFDFLINEKIDFSRLHSSKFDNRQTKENLLKTYWEESKVILSLISKPKSLHAKTTPYPSGIIQLETINASLNFSSFLRRNKLFVFRVDRNFLFLFSICLNIWSPQFEIVFLNTLLRIYLNLFFNLNFCSN